VYPSFLWLMMRAAAASWAREDTREVWSWPDLRRRVSLGRRATVATLQIGEVQEDARGTQVSVTHARTHARRTHTCILRVPY